jgi:hypothetical protein
MKLHFSCLFAIAAIPLMVMAQPTAPHVEWMQIITDSDLLSANGICPTADGGVAVTGVHTILDTIHGDRLDAYLTKLNSNGDIEWANTYGHPVCYEQPQAIVRAEDGGYVLAGLTSCDTVGTGDWGDLIILHTDASGDSLWMRQYDMSLDDMAFSIAGTADGGYILCGWEMLAEDPLPMYVLLMKTDANGDSLWTRLFRTGVRASGYSAKQTADGGYILCAIDAANINAVDNIYVVKTDGQGNSQWERTYGLDTLLEYTYDVAQTPDGGFAVTGWVYASNERADDAFILRLNADGDSLWMHTYGLDTLSGENIFKMDVRDDGGFVLGGHVSFFGSRLDSIHVDPAHPPFQAFALIGVSADGQQEWMVRTDSASVVEARGMCRTNDGGYVLAATTSMSDTLPQTEIHLVKFSRPSSGGDVPRSAVPAALALEQNYPNPFNPTTEIAFDLPLTADVTLAVFDVLGREVTRILSGKMSAGHHRVSFDGSGCASGVYFYKLTSGGVTQTRKMLLMK